MIVQNNEIYTCGVVLICIVLMLALYCFSCAVKQNQNGTTNWRVPCSYKASVAIVTTYFDY